MDAAGERPQLVHGRVEPVGAAREQRRALLVDGAVEAFLEQTQQQPRDDEPLLRAVVQVAFEAAPFGVGRGDDPHPRGPDLGELGVHLGGQPLVVQRQPGRGGHGVEMMCVLPQRRIVEQRRDPPAVAFHRPHGAL